MSGNVWEWCLTDYHNPQVDAMKDNISTDSLRVLRGGAWGLDQNFASTFSRNKLKPNMRYGSNSFRLLRPLS
jgi:formylglycine-generating enzyme required for sulfatase activity